LLRHFQKASLTLGSAIFIRIFKESHELEIWVKGNDETFKLLKTYPIACFSGTLGPKRREGDRQAPEGFYTVSPARMNPNSSFHLAFDIGYPNRYDQVHKRTGSAIMVHGGTVSVGCFAMTDSSIEEIYTIADHALNSGQPFFPVHVFPFRMTAENLKRHGASPHIAFWRSLQPGYELFEQTRRPPKVTLQGLQYAFGYEGKRDIY
jgi:murein L,D-transpeptidase YafK